MDGPCAADLGGLPYPGSTAPPLALLDMAHAYHNAAVHLFGALEGQGHVAQAPARLCAIHAIELYLNAFLRHRGERPETIRGRLHSLDDPDFSEILALRKRTREHLVWITRNREYLVVRYGPELLKGQSQTNRLLATLREIMTKTGRHLASN